MVEDLYFNLRKQQQLFINLKKNSRRRIKLDGHMLKLKRFYYNNKGTERKENVMNSWYTRRSTRRKAFERVAFQKKKSDKNYKPQST